MKAKDLRERSPEDLRELERSLAKDTFSNRMKNFTNRLDDTSVLKKTRRDLARVKTLLRQGELAAQIKTESAEAKPAAKKASKPSKKAATPKSEAK